MTLAYRTANSETSELPDVAITLEARVRRTIASHTEFNSNRIITQDNRVKYARVSSTSPQDEHLDEVFELMRQLNEAGIRSQDLGRIAKQGASFREALLESSSAIAEELNGASIVYVELGPEPVKTRFLLSALLERGVVIEKYIGVDINPQSARPMRKALEGILGNSPMEFITSAFDEVSLAQLLGANGSIALVTMLGFQEGNDDPGIVNKWLGQIARPGDLLLSESQLYTTSQSEKIARFYSEPAMQRFSRLAFERAVDRKLPTLNRFFLLPVPFLGSQIAYVAVLGEEFLSGGPDRQLHVSNFCLKLSLDQYRQYRLRGGFFSIVAESLTADETLLFQVSRRNQTP